MTTELRAAAFMSAVKGVPAYLVAKALNGCTPGVNWYGCSKRHMAKDWADAPADPRAPGHIGLKKLTLKNLKELIDAELRHRSQNNP